MDAFGLGRQGQAASTLHKPACRSWPNAARRLHRPHDRRHPPAPPRSRLVVGRRGARPSRRGRATARRAGRGAAIGAPDFRRGVAERRFKRRVVHRPPRDAERRALDGRLSGWELPPWPRRSRRSRRSSETSCAGPSKSSCGDSRSSSSTSS